MGIRDAAGGDYVSFEEGIDNTTAIGTPEIKNTLSVADNTDLIDETLASKRRGYTTVTTWGTRNGRGGFEYKNINGTTEILVAAENAVLTGSSGILGKFSGSAIPTTLRANLKDGVKPSMFQFRSLAFLLNGVDNLIYDGSTVRQIGIDGPSSAPVYVSLIAGEKVPNGSYFIAYSYYNSSTGAESNLSSPSSIVTAGSLPATAGFKFTLTPGDALLADKIRVYSSVSGGNVLFLESEVDISTTTYNSVSLDSGLGQEAELDNSRLPEPGLFGVVADNRVFVGGFASNPNRVQFSKVGITGPMPESYQALDFVDCNINDGDRVVGLAIAGENVIVIKERSVGRLIQVSAQSGGLERQGSPKYLYKEISAKVTGLAHHLCVSLDSLVFWFGRDDIYGTDGNEIFRFGKRVRNTIKALDFSKAYKWSAIVKTNSKQIMFSVTRENRSECDYQFVAHYRNFPKIAFTFYTSGPNTTTHPGLVVGHWIEVTLNGLKEYYFLSAQASGKIYRMDNGDNDDSLGIYWRMKLPWDGGAQKAAKKHFHSYYLLAAGAGVPPNNVITHTWEENTNEVAVKTGTSTISGVNPGWNNVNWLGFNWASITFGMLKFFPMRKAYLGRYGWSNTFPNQPVAVRSLAGIWQPVPLH